MKKMNRLIVVGALVLIVGAASATAYAASSYSNQAEALAGVTGRTSEDTASLRYETGTGYGTIVNDAKTLEEYKASMLRIHKEYLDEQVKAGLITRERAEEIIAVMKANQSACFGTGSFNTGGMMGAGYSGMMGAGYGGMMSAGYGGMMSPGYGGFQGYSPRNGQDQ